MTLLWFRNPRLLFTLLFCLVPHCAFCFTADLLSFVRGEHNDNIFFADSSEESDIITTVSGSLNLAEKSERLNLALSARLDQLLYRDHSDFNDLEEFYKAKLSYQLTELFLLRCSADYSVQYRADRDVAVGGFSYGTDETRATLFSLGADLSHTEKLTSFYSYSYGETTDASPANNDYQSQSALVGLSLALDIDLPTSLRLYGNGSWLDFSSSETDSYLLTLGLRQQFTELLSLTLDVGPRFSRATSKISGSSQRENNTDWGGSLDLNFQGETSRAAIILSRSIQGSSSYDGAIQRNSAKIEGTLRFTEFSWCSLSYIYNENKGDTKYSFRSNLDEQAHTITPTLRYEFSRSWSILTRYHYSHIYNRETGSNRSRNALWLELSYNLPILE